MCHVQILLSVCAWTCFILLTWPLLSVSQWCRSRNPACGDGCEDPWVCLASAGPRRTEIPFLPVPECLCEDPKKGRYMPTEYTDKFTWKSWEKWNTPSGKHAHEHKRVMANEHWCTKKRTFARSSRGSGSAWKCWLKTEFKMKNFSYDRTGERDLSPLEETKRWKKKRGNGILAPPGGNFTIDSYKSLHDM